MVLPCQFYCRTCNENRLHQWKDRGWHCAGCGCLFDAQFLKFRRAFERSSADSRRRGGLHSKLTPKREAGATGFPHLCALSTGTSDG